VAGDPTESSFRVLGKQGKFALRSCDPQNPEATWQCGAPEFSGIQVAQSQGIDTSGLGVLKVKLLTSQVAISR